MWICWFTWTLTELLRILESVEVCRLSSTSFNNYTIKTDSQTFLMRLFSKICSCVCKFAIFVGSSCQFAVSNVHSQMGQYEKVVLLSWHCYCYCPYCFVNRAAMGRARFMVYPWFFLTARPWAERGSCSTLGLFFFINRAAMGRARF